MSRKGKLRRRGLPWAASFCVLMLMVGCGQQTAVANANSRSEGSSEQGVAEEVSPTQPVVTPRPAKLASDGWGSAASTAAVHAPDNLSVYDSVAVESGAYCVAGSISEDGTDQRPYVAISSEKQSKGRILAALELPLGKYAKGRATRCFAHDGSLYALVEFDTQFGAQVSQTLLEVFRIQANTFSVTARRPVRLNKVEAAYSLWMPEGDSAFVWSGRYIQLSGKYFLLSDRNDIKLFDLRFDGNLTSKGKE